MTDRFSDQLITRAPGASPTHARTLLHELGVADAADETQRVAVQAWLDAGHDVSWLLSHSLALRGLPTSARIRA